MDTSKTSVTNSPDASNTVTEPEIHIINNADSTPFSLGQTVIALHKDVYYAAKVLKVQHENNGFKFYVHYLGWKSRWDEWLSTDHLKEYTEENLKKYGVAKKKKELKSKRQACSSNIEPGSNDVLTGKKRNIDPVMKDKDVVTTEKLVNIQIPGTLRKQLIDDCEFVNHMGKLVKLPRTPNVNDIFVKYLEYREQKDGLLDASVLQLVRLFQSYFDKALPAMLLYKGERRQYEQAMANCTSPSSVYGAEHLLRLFVRFPELLSDATNDNIIEEDELNDLQQKLVDLLKFLRKNQNGFFLSTYHVAEDIETSSTNKQDD